MQEGLALRVNAVFHDSEHLRGVEERTALVGRASGYVVEPVPVVSAAFAVALGDV